MKKVNNKKVKDNNVEKVSFLTKLKLLFNKTTYLYRENKVVFFYVFGCLINGMLLRFFTIGSVFGISQVFADLFISIFFASFFFIIKKERRFIYLLIMAFLSFAICLANVIYYFYYSSFISITFISFALTNRETGGSNVVGGLLQFKFFLFLWFPIAICFVNHFVNKRESILKRKLSKKNCLRLMYIWCFIFLGLLLTTLKGVDYGRFYNQWNREYLVNKFGVYLYQLNDVVKSIEPKMATLFGSDKAYKNISEYYEKRSDKQNYSNEYTNVFKDKNVIAIHAESLQNILINMEINGVEITPNLNKLVDEGLYFSNFHSQVSFGTSSDTEFTIATSLMPVKSGTVFINYSDKEYISMYKLLKEKGYYTFSMHANTGDFWNRNIMHKNLGYDKFYEKASYNIDEQVGFGLSDRSFVLQSVEYIKEIAKNNDKYYGTLITLSNHTPFSYDPLFEELDLTKKVKGVKYQYMEDTKLGDYFVSAHYADKQLGLLISSLEKNDLLDDTIIMIYGDHDARISKSLWDRFYNYDYKTNGILDEDDLRYKELDYYWQEMNRSVPLIMWTNNTEFKNNYSKTIDTAMGMYDVLPTLGNMIGIYDKYALGHDIMEMKDNLVVFPNGNFLTNYVYYNDNKGQYKLLKDVPLSENYIIKNKEKTEKILDISNDIIVYNYFKKELSSNTYVKEE